MESSSKIGIFYLVFYFFGTVMCRSMPPVRHYTLDRLNIKRVELKHMCDEKGEKLYDDIHEKHISFTLNLRERFMTWKKEISPTDDVYKLVQERCNKDTALKDMLKKFIESSQMCLEEKDRLKDDKLQGLTSRLLELFCAQYIHSHAFSSDEGCLDLVTNAAIDTCKEKYKTDQFIPLPFVYSNKECNDYQKYSECRLEAMKSCKDATKTAVEAADSIMFHTFYGCQNISVIPEKITIKRSPVEDSEIIRFNLNQREIIIRCAIHAKTPLEDLMNSLSVNILAYQNERKAIYMKTDLMKITDPDEQEFMIQESCLNNPVMKNALKSIYETLEVCIPEDKRLTYEKKAQLLKQSLNEKCAEIRIGVRRITSGQQCLQDLIEPSKMQLCGRRTVTTLPLLSAIPLPFKETPVECDEIIRSQKCELDFLDACEPALQMAYKTRFIESLKFYGCYDRFMSGNETTISLE